MAFINGKEVLFMASGGMATVVVPGTSDTDLGVPGIVYMADERSGLRLDDLQRLSIASASITDVDRRLSETKPIVPARLDYAVKSSLTANTETWTDDTTDGNGEVVKGDKTKARELIGAVGFNDVATRDKLGLVMAGDINNSGIRITEKGVLDIQSPSVTNLKARGTYKPITPKEMDMAFWLGMTGYKEVWNGSLGNMVGSYGNHYKHLTDEEKGYARRWLGVYHDIVSEEYKGDEYDIGGGSTGIEFGGYYLATTNIPSMNELDKYVAYFDAYDSATSYQEYFSFTLDRFNVTEMQGAKKLSFSIPNVPQTIVLIVTDCDDCNSAYGTSFVSNGVYLGYNWNDYMDGNSQMHSYGSRVLSLCKITRTEKIPDRFLDLANSPVINSLLARIEELESKLNS